MIIRILFLFGVFSGVLHAQPTVKNLDLPLFDPSGRLVRRLMATSGSAPGRSLEVLVLKSGTVEFFGPDGAKPEKIGTLTFADATYRKADGVIESDGPMQLRFTNGTLAAVGFHYVLSTGRLLLRSAVVLDFPEAHVTGREGEVFLMQNQADQDMLVSSATIRREVTITEFDVKGINADRLETAYATYTGSDSMLRPALPVVGWNKGIKAGEFGGEELSIPIVRKSRSALASPSVGTPEKNSVRPGRD